ncbi:MAG TPA: nuclear transport factor 2 family protein [Gaiellaceae bacterium]|nr:nuclear transport factor 2 family protein [Gaiellaceae bacterium]
MRGSLRVIVSACCAALAAASLLAGCGGSGKDAAASATIQRQATLYQILQIEVKFHQAVAKHDLNLMMSLFAPGAVFNVDQQALTGKAQIRHWFATENKAFMPQNHWVADTPTYKIRITLDGDKGTLYFECHYIDAKTREVMAVVGVDHDVQKINGRWLIVNSSASTPVLSP